MKRSLLTLMMSLLLALSVSSVAQIDGVTNTTDLGNDQTTDSDVTTFVTDDLTVQVPTSQVPFYYFWETGDNSSTYRVQFDALYEAVDNNTNDQYDPENDTVIGDSMQALASYTWDISEFANDTSDGVTTTSFNLTGVAINPVGKDLQVQFRNHLITDDNGTELKFDIVINNYEWTSTSQDNLLVLAYKLQSTDPSYDAPQDANNTARFGAGYFDAVPTASNSTGQDVSDDVRAAVTTGQGSSYNETSDDNDGRIYMSYTYFEGNLTHDPTLGIDQTQGPSTPEEGEKTFISGDIAVNVPSAQVPFFFFYNSSDENPETYEVKFFLMYEVNDSNDNGLYDPETESMVSNSAVALPSMSWTMSDLLNDTDNSGNVIATHFNLTGTATVANTVQPNLEVQFRIHIDQSNGTSFKYDVVINNYEWVQDTDDTLLVLGYKLTTNSSDYSDEPALDNSTANFGNAYFSSNSTAVANGTQISTGLSTGTGNNTDEGMIYQSYSHFDGNMTHDPTLGLQASPIDDDTSGGDDTSDGDDTDDASLSFNIIALSAVATLVAIPVLRRRFQ